MKWWEEMIRVKLDCRAAHEVGSSSGPLRNTKANCWGWWLNRSEMKTWESSIRSSVYMRVRLVPDEQENTKIDSNCRAELTTTADFSSSSSIWVASTVRWLTDGQMWPMWQLVRIFIKIERSDRDWDGKEKSLGERKSEKCNEDSSRNGREAKSSCYCFWLSAFSYLDEKKTIKRKSERK